jgi:hypothetical protein|tara:strand:- start:700 stop:822 length:123 start_codon:yes stop_codon:yes gene_type:complete
MEDDIRKVAKILNAYRISETEIREFLMNTIRNKEQVEIKL